jgi:hypothetical protein
VAAWIAELQPDLKLKEEMLCQANHYPARPIIEWIAEANANTRA